MKGLPEGYRIEMRDADPNPRYQTMDGNLRLYKGEMFLSKESIYVHGLNGAYRRLVKFAKRHRKWRIG